MAVGSHVLRVAVSAAITFVAYSAYVWCVVPMIEPEAAWAEVDPAGTLTDIPDRGERPTIPPDDAMLAWFGHQPGAWELDSPKRLENDQGILLLREYTNLGNGKLKIKPCTIVFMSDDESKPREERIRAAIILQAPEGAILKFDRDIDLRRGDIGRVESGLLLGKVTIRSDQKLPGPDDDLAISTFDVALTPEAIQTPHTVQFRWGPNHGSGRGMQIDLLDEKTAKKKGVERKFGRVKLLTLSHDVQMNFQFKGKAAPGDIAAAAQSEPQQEASEGTTTPVTVTCRGPFRFDFHQYLATFEEQVDVLRINSPGPSDRLACEVLELFLKPETPPEGQAAEKDRVPKLEPERLVAKGNPVVLSAPSSAVYARGEKLTYEVPTRRISLESNREVVFREQTNEIHAQQLHYQPGPDGRIGQFLAVGQGWLNWIVPENNRDARAPAAQSETQRRFEARWTKQLHSRPHEGQQVISIEGQTVSQMTGMGKLAAEEVHVWMREDMVPRTPADPGGPPAAGLMANNANQSKLRPKLSPQRMMARGSVDIRSPQLTGRTEKLEAWFVEAPPRVPMQQGGGAQMVHPAAAHMQPVQPMGGVAGMQQVGAVQGYAAYPGSAPAAPRQAALPYPTTGTPAGIAASAIQPGAIPSRAVQPQPPYQQLRPDVPGQQLPQPQPQPQQPQQQFDVRGDLVRVEMRVIGEEMELSEVVIDGNARLHETQTPKPGERPMLITGDRIHAVQQQPDAAVVTVVGKPGHVEGRGLALDGAAVNLDQATNKVWIDGPGQMTLLIERGLQGETLAQPVPLVVDWQGGMQFDGQQATFEREVVARHQQEQLQTQTLEVMFTERVSFVRQERPANRPEVAVIRCRNGVYMQRRALDERGQLDSYEQMQTADLTIDQRTGGVFGSGPGWITRVGYNQRGESSPLASGRGALAGAAASAPKEKQLTYLRVDFNRSLTGNIRRRQMIFGDNVQTVYAPVPAWDATVNPNRVEQLGPEGVVLTCRQLTVTQMQAGQDQKWFEMVADGNTVVEGQTFTANAQRMTYTEDKGLLVLEGTPRTAAELWRQEKVGSKVSRAAARKIMFWVDTNRIEVDGAEFLDLSQMPRGPQNQGQPQQPQQPAPPATGQAPRVLPPR